MPLQSPNLDDRRYADLMAEALALIPAYAPEWTNHNASDPGITLVELFAYLTDMLLYRLNRVTGDNIEKFLKLLNGPDWNMPANADLRDQIRLAVLRIRERYRAVTKDDYEFLSTETFNQYRKSANLAVSAVARAHCVPQRNLDAGTEADRLKLKPEHVSVVIIPAEAKSNLNPQPDATLISALFAFLDERRMLTTKIHVTGPFYAHVDADLVVARRSDVPEGDLRAVIVSELTRFFNPLPSDDGPGWPFGRDVFVSDVYERLEQIPGIDFITDVMLTSRCGAGDSKCVVAEPIWHEDGGFVGLRIHEHHLPVFNSAKIVIAPDTSFVIVNLAVTVKAAANSDTSLLKRAIKSTVRTLFHPGINGPGLNSTQATDIFVSDVQLAIKNIAGITAASVVAECVPSQALQPGTDRGPFIHVEPRKIVDWRVRIEFSA